MTYSGAKIRVFQLCAGLVLSFVATVGCGGDSMTAGDAQEKRSATAQKEVAWNLVEVRSADSVRLVSHVEYCAGDREPVISDVAIRESEQAVVITVKAEVAQPPIKERDVACLGAARPLYRNVQLMSPLGDRAILDGSVSPPVQRWPTKP